MQLDISILKTVDECLFESLEQFSCMSILCHLRSHGMDYISYFRFHVTGGSMHHFGNVQMCMLLDEILTLILQLQASGIGNSPGCTTAVS